MRGLEDDEIQSGVSHFLFGQEFRAFVIDPALASALLHVFAQDTMGKMRIRRHTGGMQDLFDAIRFRRCNQILHATDIGPGLRGIIDSPGIGIGGGMKNGVDTFRSPQQGIGIRHFCPHRLCALRCQQGIGLFRTRQGLDLMTGGDEFALDMLAQKAGGTGQ